MSDWTKIDASFSGTPAITTWGKHTNVFVKGKNNRIYNKWRDGDGDWSSGWQDLGNDAVYGNISAVSWGPNRIDLFCVGFDGACYHKWWDGSNWNGSQRLGSTAVVNSDISAVSMNGGKLNLFARNMSNQLIHMYWNGTVWSDWQVLGADILGAPTAISRTANRLDVFVRGYDNQPWVKSYNGIAWGGWTSLGGVVSDNITVTSFGAKRLDVFVRTPDDSVQHKKWVDGTWDSDWEQLSSSGNVLSRPAAVGWGGKNIILARQGNDNKIWVRLWDQDYTAWGEWTSLGGITTGSPVIHPAGGDPPVVFHRGADGALYVYQ